MKIYWDNAGPSERIILTQMPPDHKVELCWLEQRHIFLLSGDAIF